MQRPMYSVKTLLLAYCVRQAKTFEPGVEVGTFTVKRSRLAPVAGFGDTAVST